MRTTAILVSLLIVVICIAWYFYWDRIAAFIKQRSWRALTIIALAVFFVIGAAAAPMALRDTGGPAAKATAAQRLEAKYDFYTWFLRQGYEPLVRVRGDNAEIMDVTNELFTRVTVQRFVDQGTLAKEARRLGFKYIDFYDVRGEALGRITP